MSTVATPKVTAPAVQAVKDSPVPAQIEPLTVEKRDTLLTLIADNADVIRAIAGMSSTSENRSALDGHRLAEQLADNLEQMVTVGGSLIAAARELLTRAGGQATRADNGQRSYSVRELIGGYVNVADTAGSIRKAATAKYRTQK